MKPFNDDNEVFFASIENSSMILDNLKRHKMVKIAKFGTFILREKKSRIGRNPKTKEKKLISQRKVVLFKPSKELKKKVNF